MPEKVKQLVQDPLAKLLLALITGLIGYREYKDSSHEPTTGNAVIIQRLDMLDKKFETLDRSLDQIQSELRGLVTVSVRHSEHFDAIDKAIGKLETQAERVIRLESEMETMKRKQP